MQLGKTCQAFWGHHHLCGHIKPTFTVVISALNMAQITTVQLRLMGNPRAAVRSFVNPLMATQPIKQFCALHAQGFGSIGNAQIAISLRNARRDIFNLPSEAG